MLKKESKKKINFIKNYWFSILNIDIYSYEEFKLNNFNTYLNEAIEIIDLMKYIEYPKKKTHGLYFFLNEFESYLRNNYFFNCEYKEAINSIMSKITPIINVSENETIKPYLKSLREELVLIKKMQKNNISRMLKALRFYVYQSSSLEESISEAKSLVNDLIVELLLNNYSLNFLKKEVYKETDFDRVNKKVINNSLKTQFETKIEVLESKLNRKKIVVVFRIENLKIKSPFEVEEVIFYNPIRTDLLEWKFKKKLLRSEKGLLTIEQSRLIDKPLPSSSEKEQWQLIRNTDAHCRVELQGVDPDNAVIIARKKIGKLINLLRFIYNIKHIRVSEERVLQYGVRSKAPLFRITRDRNSIVGMGNIHPSKELKEDLVSEESILNKFLNDTNPGKEAFLKGLRSLHIGEDEKLNLNKFIHYWVSLEYLVGINGTGSIKSIINDKGSKILTRNYYRVELYSIYSRLRDYFYNASGGLSIDRTKIPSEITEIKGLEDFMFGCDGLILAENLHVFLKYSKDEFLNFKIKSFIYLYLDVKERKEHNRNLERSYKHLLSRLYRLRNKIMHSALVDEIELEVYTNWLYSLLIALCNNLLERINNNDDILLPQKLDIGYVEWKKEIFNKRNSLIL